MNDFEAYLHRIGLDPADAPSWQSIHLAHATRIPFENLDSQRGLPVSLDPVDLERKLVAQRRGGYCFEQNLLLAMALEHEGLQVDPMLARVRVGGAPSESRMAGHLVLRVTDSDESQWLADVGFGMGTLLEPIPFAPAGSQDQFGWTFQLVWEQSELVLQTKSLDGWLDVYSFAPTPVSKIDIDVSNWWICTNPASPFVTGLIACCNHPDGRREIMSDWSGQLQVTSISPDSSTSMLATRDSVPSLLTERFDLPGFSINEKGRVAPFQ
jgi:N-hydroxyarylamine O-acetyltransferase